MDERILRKIKRCLALARSSNPNEAATALRQAQAMMAQHGVTSEDVAVNDVTSQKAKTGAGKKPPQYLVMLIKLVSRAFGAEPIYSPEHDGERWSAHVEFIGIEGAAEIAAYAFEVLGRQLRRDRTAFLSTLNKRLKRTTRMRRGDLYAEGWLAAVSKQVTTTERSPEQDKAIEAYQSRFHGELDKVKSKARKMHKRDVSALVEGHRDGSKVQFYSGVNGTQQDRIGREVEHG